MTVAFAMKIAPEFKPDEDVFRDDFNERMLWRQLRPWSFRCAIRTPPTPTSRRKRMRRKAGVKEGVQRSGAGASLRQLTLVRSD